MSWQSYVDDHLIGSGCVTQAAIFGTGGDQWAASKGFKVKPDEVKSLVANFSKPDKLAASGVIIGGTKYMFVRLEPNKEIQGKLVRRPRWGGGRMGRERR